MDECLYCGQTGHFILVCPVWPKGWARQQTPASTPFAHLCVGSLVFPLKALIDSGAQDSLLDEELAMQARCLLEPLPSPFTATALDGRIIAWVTHKMVPVTLITSGTIFNRFNSSPLQTLMVLGYP